MDVGHSHSVSLEYRYVVHQYIAFFFITANQAEGYVRIKT